MGDYNPQSPILLGQEWQPIAEQALVFGSPSSGYAQRIRPGAVTLAAIHRFHQEVIGAAPGVALEVVDTLMPAISASSYFPGTDLGALTTTGSPRYRSGTRAGHVSTAAPAGHVTSMPVSTGLSRIAKSRPIFSSTSRTSPT